MAVKKPTFRYFVYKNGEKVNVDTLSQEEKIYAGTWAYQTMVKNLGYEPLKTEGTRDEARN